MWSNLYGVLFGFSELFICEIAFKRGVFLKREDFSSVENSSCFEFLVIDWIFSLKMKSEITQFQMLQKFQFFRDNLQFFRQVPCNIKMFKAGLRVRFFFIRLGVSFSEMIRSFSCNPFVNIKMFKIGLRIRFFKGSDTVIPEVEKRIRIWV